MMLHATYRSPAQGNMYMGIARVRKEKSPFSTEWLATFNKLPGTMSANESDGKFLP
jgi:hypothetical protein